MPLPLKILNRLRIGRDVAARVPAPADNLAWVYTYPIPDPETVVLRQGTTQISVEYAGTAPPFLGFLVRYLEVTQAAMQQFDPFDGRPFADPVVDIRKIVKTEAELADTLGRWVTDFTTLHIPEDVGYRIENGNQLTKWWPRDHRRLSASEA